MVRHCDLWRNHILRHRSECWECTFQMSYNCHYLECIHTYDPGSHYIQTRHIHLSCLLFHHLLSTFQRTHHFYNNVLCLNKTFYPTNHHSGCIRHIPPIVLCIRTSPIHNHYQTVTITFEQSTWTLTSDLIWIIITVLPSIAHTWWWHIARWWKFGIWEMNFFQNIDKKHIKMSQAKNVG